MRGKLGFFSRVTVWLPISASQELQGGGTIGSPASNAALATDITVTVNQSGRLYWSGLVGDGLNSYEYYIQYQGITFEYGFATQINGSILLSSGESIRFVFPDQGVTSGNLQLWLV